MCDPSDERGAEAEADHGFGHVEAALVMADEAAPAGHPAEGTFHDRATGENLEALLVCELAHDLDREVALGGEARQPARVIGSFGKEVL